MTIPVLRVNSVVSRWKHIIYRIIAVVRGPSPDTTPVHFYRGIRSVYSPRRSEPNVLPDPTFPSARAIAPMHRRLFAGNNPGIARDTASGLRSRTDGSESGKKRENSRPRRCDASAPTSQVHDSLIIVSRLALIMIIRR